MPRVMNPDGEQECANCTGVYSPADEGDETYCGTCTDARWDCGECGCSHFGDDEQSYPNGIFNDPVCDSCVDDNYTECASCHTTIRNDDTYGVDGETYCESCYSDLYCEDCGEHHEYGECESVAHPYNYQPDFRFYGKSPDSLHMGIELEMETGGRNSEVFAPFRAALGERFYGKHDGSLNDGIEIVSMPHTFAEWRKLGPDLIDALTKARTAGAVAWDTSTAGMHIHVSTATFTEAHLLRFARLIYMNRAHVTAFAGRDNSQWAAFDDETTAIVAEVKQHKAGMGGMARYKAVNLCNSQTVEVRIFRGTVRGERVLANLEFVHAAVEYTRTQRVGAKPNWALFVKWALKREQYQHFTQIADGILHGTFDTDAVESGR